MKLPSQELKKKRPHQSWWRRDANGSGAGVSPASGDQPIAKGKREPLWGGRLARPTENYSTTTVSGGCDA